MIKKFIKSIFSILIIYGFIGICLANNKFGGQGGTELNPDFPWDPSKKIQTTCDGNTNEGDCVSLNESDDTIILRLLEVFGLDNDSSKDLKFIDYAKAIMNMALGLIAFLALIMSIYTFYLMFFTENEAGIKKAKGNLFGIFIALAIIGLAWLIVSVIFRWYEKNWKEKEEFIQSNDVSMNIYDEELNNNNVYLVI